ncbi:MAG: ribosome silencing factor [Clostridia bacterium]|nr:ribosome silencing factor [Clostridia bacterium]
MQEKEKTTAAESLETARKIIRILDERKGRDLKLLHVEKFTTIADYYVLCSGNSRTQVNALTDEVIFKMREQGVEPLRLEGGESGVWNLIDYGPVLVHVFSREGREYYHLDQLFGETTETDIRDLLTQD